MSVPENVISECFDGPTGTQLQLEAEQLTKVISPSFVPTIVYNWVRIRTLYYISIGMLMWNIPISFQKFDQKLQDRSLRNFLTVVCQQIGNAAPACQ